MSPPRPRVACIAPAWNEGERVAETVRAVPAGSVDAVVVVDDGSTDDTRTQAERAGALVLSHPGNRGVGAAIRTGLGWAKGQGFEVAVVVSGAGKTPPGQIPLLLQPVLGGQADFVQGSRYLPGGSQARMPLDRRLGTRAYSRLFALLCRRPVTDASCGFRAFRLALLDEEGIDLAPGWLDRYELEPYLLWRALRGKGRVVEVPVHIEYPPPQPGRSYTKMRAVTGWWSIFRPVLLLALGVRR